MATPLRTDGLTPRVSWLANCWRAWPLIVILAVDAIAAPGGPPGPEVERRIDALPARMTIEEKVGQLLQVDGFPDTGRPREDHFDLARQGLRGAGAP